MWVLNTDSDTLINIDKVNKVYIWHNVSKNVYEVTVAFDPYTDGENEIILSSHATYDEAKEGIKHLMDLINRGV